MDGSNKMKKLSTILVTIGIATIGMLHTIDASLQWTQFRAHNNVVSVEAPRNTTETQLDWAVDITGDYDTMTNAIVVDGFIYIASEADNRIVKLNEKGNEVASAKLDGSIGYNGYIAYGDGMVFVSLSETEFDDSWNVISTSTKVQAFDAKTLTTAWISEELGIPGSNEVIQSPIIYYNGFIYFGTANLSMTSGSYIAMSTAKDESEQVNQEKQIAWRYTPNNESSYLWSGGQIINNTIVFSSNSGELVACSLSDGTILATKDIDDSVTSSISYDNGYIYLTTRSANLYKIGYNDSMYFGEQDVLTVWEGGSMSATPTIYDGKIYLGGSTDVNDFEASGFVAIIDQSSFDIIYQSEVEGNVQSSLLVNTFYDEVYAYFTQNVQEGALYSMSVNNDDIVIEKVFIPKSDQQNFCTTSVITDGNMLYHTNDSGYIMALSIDDTLSSSGKNQSLENTNQTLIFAGSIAGIVIIVWVVKKGKLSKIVSTKK